MRAGVHPLAGLCKKVSCGPCHYCDRDRSSHQHDHAPVPKRAGGLEVVVACLMCHDLKDRYSLESWPAALAVMAVTELVKSGSVPPPSAKEWPANWGDLSGHARVLWAKMAAVDTDRAAILAATT